MVCLSHRVLPDQIKPGDHIYTWRVLSTYAHHGIYLGENMVIHFTASSGSSRNLSSGFSSSCLNSSVGGSSRPSCDHDCEVLYPESGVTVSCLRCFTGRGSLYLYQYGVSKFEHGSKRGGTCTMALSDPPEQVIYRAIYLLETGFRKYHLFRNNCEDFSLYCKTGRLVMGKPTTGSSGQVNSVTPSMAVLPVWVSFGLTTVEIAAEEVGTAILFPAAAVPVAGAAMIVWKHFKRKYRKDIGVRGDAKKTKVEDVCGGWASE